MDPSIFMRTKMIESVKIKHIQTPQFTVSAMHTLGEAGLSVAGVCSSTRLSFFLVSSGNIFLFFLKSQHFPPIHTTHRHAELILNFFFHKFSNFTPPPSQDISDRDLDKASSQVTRVLIRQILNSPSAVQQCEYYILLGE